MPAIDFTFATPLHPHHLHHVVDRLKMEVQEGAWDDILAPAGKAVKQGTFTRTNPKSRADTMPSFQPRIDRMKWAPTNPRE